MSEAGAADEYHAKARMHARESRGELDDADAADLDDVVPSVHASPEGFLRTVVSDRGTFTQPFTTSDFEAQICDHLRTSSIGGYYSYHDYFRQALVDDLFIEDTSDPRRYGHGLCSSMSCCASGTLHHARCRVLSEA